jgi:hypothetical protein
MHAYMIGVMFGNPEVTVANTDLLDIQQLWGRHGAAHPTLVLIPRRHLHDEGGNDVVGSQSAQHLD